MRRANRDKFVHVASPEIAAHRKERLRDHLARDQSPHAVSDYVRLDGRNIQTSLEVGDVILNFDNKKTCVVGKSQRALADCRQLSGRDRRRRRGEGRYRIIEVGYTDEKPGIAANVRIWKP